MLPRKPLNPNQALQKARQYCAYQERSHSEVKEKLYSFGLRKNDDEQVLTQLIEEDYCNEERFAELFAGGKFRMKQWGKIKIRHALQEKRISEYCIKKALRAISDDDYSKTLEKIANQRWESVKTEKNIFTRMAKTRDYLMQKGYESELVSKIVQHLKSPDALS